MGESIIPTQDFKGNIITIIFPTAHNYNFCLQIKPKFKSSYNMFESLILNRYNHFCLC